MIKILFALAIVMKSGGDFKTPPDFNPNLSAQEAQKIEWLSPTSHDFGDIPLGKPVKVKFRFKNIGAEVLTVDNVRSACSCTAADWAEEVVEPGKEGHLEIEYDAKNPGYFHKKITVYFSGQRKAEKLHVEGFVE